MLQTANSRGKRRGGGLTDAVLWVGAGGAAVFLVAVLVLARGCPHAAQKTQLLLVTSQGGGAAAPYRPRPLQANAADVGAGVGRVADAAAVMPWDYYVPTHECTRGEDVVGRSAHGRGVWVCGVLDLLQTRPCVVYVTGEPEPTAFERDILRLTPCTVHIFSPQRAEAEVEATATTTEKEDKDKDKNGRLHVHAYALGLEDSDEGATRTPESAMAALGHGHADLVVVAPHRASLEVAAALAQCRRWVGQVALGVRYSPAALRALKPATRLAMQRDFAALNATMARAGFVLVRREENNFHPRTVQMLYGSLRPRPSSSSPPSL